MNHQSSKRIIIKTDTKKSNERSPRIQTKMDPKILEILEIKNVRNKHKRFQKRSTHTHANKQKTKANYPHLMFLHIYFTHLIHYDIYIIYYKLIQKKYQCISKSIVIRQGHEPALFHSSNQSYLLQSILIQSFRLRIQHLYYK